MEKLVFTVPPEFGGEEWSGEYEVHEIPAPERDKIDEAVTETYYDEDAARMLGRMNTEEWRKQLVCASVKKPEITSQKWEEMGSKMRDLLWRAAYKLNYATEAEIRFLLKTSSSENPSSN